MQGNLRTGTLAMVTATALVVGGPAAFADKPASPPGQAGKAEGSGAPAPPPHAPAHGVRGTEPAGRSSQGTEARDGRPTAPSRGARGERRGKAAPPARGGSRGASSPTPGGRDARRTSGDRGPRRSATDRSARRSAADRASSGNRDTRRSSADRDARGASGDAPKGGQPKTTICHATGSATNPYVEITIAAPAVRAHERHQDGRDIVPAPAGGCPTAATAPAADGTLRTLATTVAAVLGVDATRGAAASGAPAAGTPTPAATTAAEAREPAALDTSAMLGEAGREPAQEVLGATASAPASDVAGVDGAVAGQEAATVSAPVELDEEDGLPFTGLDLVWMLAAAAAALLAGIALRRATVTRRASL